MLKKSILSLSILAMFSLSSFAEQANTDKHKNAAKNIMSSFNIKDYKKLSNDFNQNIADVLTEDKIKEVVDSLQNQFGQIKNIGEPVLVAENTYAFLTDFEKGQLNLILNFDNKDKIAGILFQPLQQASIKYPEIINGTSIDEIIKPYLDEKNNVGVAIGIIHGDKGDEQRFSFGKTAKDKDKVINDNTIFEIGSISKVFTTTALADMYLNKELDLNDPIAKYLPKSENVLEFNNRKVNFIDLATHTSGLPRLPEDLGNTVKNQLEPYAEYTKDNLYSYAQNYKLKSEPGKTYDYSNLGMGLIGDVLGDIENTSYEGIINKHITSKLNMKNTGINFNRTQIMNFATGHNENGEAVPMWDFKSMAGAGAIKSNLNDMMIFLSANMGLLPKNPLQKAMDLAHQVKFQQKGLDLGLGWHISPTDKGDKVIWHNGGTGGFRSFIGFIKEKKIGVVILSNSSTSVDEPAMLILKKLSYN